MRPIHILFFLLAVFSLVIGVSAIWPKDGVRLAEDFKLSFVTFEEIFEKDSTETLNLDSLLASYEVEFDSTAIKDSIRLAQLAYRKMVMRIQYADSADRLTRFFAALERSKSGTGSVRILHYGDSQVEGDRITSEVRNGLQRAFGGSGPGYIAAYPLSESMSLENLRSENWRRLPVFGNRDSTLTHNKFGMYGVFSRFTDFPVTDTIYQDSIRTQITRTIEDQEVTKDTLIVLEPIVRTTLPHDSVVSAWIELKPSPIGYYSSRRFTKFQLLFRNPDAPFKMRVILPDSSVTERVFPMNPYSQNYVQSFEDSPASIRLEFEAVSSPDVFGIRLENDFGVTMDNIPMRGSSGTYFGKIAHGEMANQFAETKASLIILQFGGNTLPYLEDEAEVERYGGWFASQIRYLKRMNPQADFVLIGPSDMSIKEGTRFVTYPLLPKLRDVLKAEAFANEIGYWDMYEVMGGRNSMPVWVAADPPLASSDYVHFTRPGTRKIGELFLDALMKDYEEYATQE